jgi:phosphopantetheinyl transferase
VAHPSVRLLDARELRVDDDGLRAAARDLCEGAPHASRSYRAPYALVALHDAQVGVDLERVELHDLAFGESISTASERVALAQIEDLGRYLSSLWSSKEALSKALGDALSYDPRRLESPLHWPEGRSGPWHAEQLVAPPGHVAWLCWRSPSS